MITGTTVRGIDPGGASRPEASASPFPTLEADPSERRKAAERSAQALRSAGVSLAPESEGFGDPHLALTLMRESFIAAACAVSGVARLHGISEARAAVEARPERPPRLKGERWQALCDLLEGEATARLETLRRTEATLGDLVSWALGERQRPSRVLLLLAASLAVGALVIGIPRFRAAPTWAGFSWRSSTSLDGFPSSGKLGDSRHRELLFHTAQQDRPWLLIDLNTPRKIGRVVVHNRRDCCFERGLPLTVEVGETEQTLKAVGQRSDLYDVWQVEFSPREARYVRVRAESTTYLHLGGVEVE